jgi:hypothetical protein
VSENRCRGECLKPRQTKQRKDEAKDVVTFNDRVQHNLHWLLFISYYGDEMMLRWAVHITCMEETRKPFKICRKTWRDHLLDLGFDEPSGLLHNRLRPSACRDKLHASSLVRAWQIWTLIVAYSRVCAILLTGNVICSVLLVRVIRFLACNCLLQFVFCRSRGCKEVRLSIGRNFVSADMCSDLWIVFKDGVIHTGCKWK